MDQIINFLPEHYRVILDFQAITSSEDEEFARVREGIARITADTLILDASLARVEDWEQLLDLPAEGTLDERRQAILAHLRGTGKLNTEMIKSVVKVYADNDCVTWFDGNQSIIYISVKIPAGQTFEDFQRIYDTLIHKVPAHLGLFVQRHYANWGEVRDNYDDWQAVKDNYSDWAEVRIRWEFE